MRLHPNVEARQVPKFRRVIFRNSEVIGAHLLHFILHLGALHSLGAEI